MIFQAMLDEMEALPVWAGVTEAMRVVEARQTEIEDLIEEQIEEQLNKLLDTERIARHVAEAVVAKIGV